MRGFCFQMMTLLVVLFSAVVVHPTRAADPIGPASVTTDPKPATNAPKPLTGAKTLATAIAKLGKEYDTYLRDKDAPIRSVSDFFTDNRPADVTVDDVLAALEKNSSGDVRTAVYVKWQLLSALPGDPTPAVVKRIAELYRKAPKLYVRPGQSPDERKKLERMRAYVYTDAVKVNKDLNDAIARVDASNAPNFAYRDELYSRLPAGLVKFTAGFNDASERLNAVSIDGVRLKVAQLVDDISMWAGASAAPDAREVDQVVQMIAKAKDANGQDYYQSGQVSGGTLYWSKNTARLDAEGELDLLYRRLRMNKTGMLNVGGGQ